MEVDDFEFDLVSDFAGYNSSRDKTNINEKYMVLGSKNVYKKLSGTVAVRPGLKRRGSADTTSAEVKSSFEWNSSLGLIRPLRYCNGKLQVESDIVTSGTYVWYDLLTSLTADSIVFDTWWDNSAKKDILLFVLGSTTLYHWNGGIGVIAGTAAATITLSATAATQGFDASGSVIINGTTYTYSGRSGSDLTGVAPTPVGEANGSVVILATGTDANTPAASFTNDFIKTIGNRVHVGSYTSRLIYISSNSSYTNYTVPSPRTPGSPELLTLDDQAKGISAKQGNAWITAGTSDWYEIIYTDENIPDGSGGALLTQTTKVDKKPTSALNAALRHEFIDTIGDDIVYMSQDQQLQVIGTFRNLFNTRYPTLSLPVKDEFKSVDFTGGHLKAINDIIYITAPTSGIDYMHQTREIIDEQGNITAERVWHPPQVRNVSRFAVISGVTYGHSNANPQIYQIWDTLQWHDDSPDDEPLPYECRMKMAYRHADRRNAKLTFNKAYYEGYIAPGSDVNSNHYFDYQGSTAVQGVNINENDNPVKIYSGTLSPSLGDASLGAYPLGQGYSDIATDQELLPKFRAICGINPVDCFEHQIEVYSDTPDARWEILALGVNITRALSKAVEIQR